MNNIIVEYIKNILLQLGAPEDEIQETANQIFLLTLDKTLPEISSQEDINKLSELIKAKDETGINNFLAALPTSKFQSIFFIKLQDTLKSFFETVLVEFNEEELADFMVKFQNLVNEESIGKYKDLSPDEFLKTISK